MQYQNNKLCLEYDELVPAILSEPNYKYHKAQGNITVYGIGGNGRIVLIEFETLPTKYKHLIRKKYGDPYVYISKQPILNSLEWDWEAQKFYQGYVLPNGSKLPSSDKDSNGKDQINYVHRYTTAATWLNMLIRLTSDKRALKRELNISIADFWETATEMIKIKNVNIPATPTRLKQKIKIYKEGGGYESIVEKHKFGNTSAAKVVGDLATAYLKELLSLRNKHDDTVIAEEYNRFAVEQNLETITPETVGYRRRQWANELFLEREGMGKTYNKLSKRIHRERASGPLLLVNSDDNNFDAYFINGNNKWYRPALYVVLDAYNDYILGYAIGDTVTKELIYEAYRNAMNHVRELTGGSYLPLQIQTDHWGISGKNTTDLEKYYNSIATFTPAGLKNAQTKYIEAAFGVTWHQMLKKLFKHNYSGHNITSKEKLNTDLLRTSNFPDVKDMPKMISMFIEAMRRTKRKNEKINRQEEWLLAFETSEKSKKKAIDSETRLRLFGKVHSPNNRLYANTITAAGLTPTINGTSYVYEMSQADIYQHNGKLVQITYDPYDPSEILATDGKGFRQVLTQFNKTKAAIADYQDGDRARINNLLDEKKTLIPLIQGAIEGRKELLDRHKIDAESRLQANVMDKAIAYQDTKLIHAINNGASDDQISDDDNTDIYSLM